MLKLLYFHCLHPTECSTQLAEITVQLRGTPLMFAYCHSLMSMVPSSSVCSANDKIVSTQNLSQQDLWIFFSITNSGFLKGFETGIYYKRQDLPEFHLGTIFELLPENGLYSLLPAMFRYLIVYISSCTDQIKSSLFI